MPMIGTDKSSPWHDGELAIHKSIGIEARMDAVGRKSVRHHLTDQHRAFYPLLPFVVLGTVDPTSDVWATIRAGHPGFLHAPDASRLELAMGRERSDPADAGLEDGDGIALLGIELATRRRNRLNGTVRRDTPKSFAIEVGQSYGNCPQYIRLRSVAFECDPHRPTAIPPVTSHALDESACTIVAKADTFFVATYFERADGHREVDVSHRGGRPGFVSIGEDGTFTIPDFAGNLFFNTLGNILANPRAGLVFVDFTTGDLLQITGEAKVILDSPEIATFQGAERLWRFTPKTIIFRAGALPLCFPSTDGGQSPNALATGTWTDAAGRAQAAKLAESWRPFHIARIVDESVRIRSFHLEPTDGLGLIPHKAGQHLPVRVTLDGGPAMRNYTLSTAPSDGIYRISVKAEGAVSHHLHGLAVGDIIEAQAPAGAFTIDAAERRQAVLLAGGIGITPILAMLRHISYEGLRTGHIRPTWVFYAAKLLIERAFDTELQQLVATTGGAVHLVRVLSTGDGAVVGRDYDHTGRIDMATLTAELPFNDYDFYLCGPPTFMQAIYDGLRGFDIADDRIHAEAFGPGSMRRTRPKAGAAPHKAPSDGAVSVTFQRSGKKARWTPESGSLLELAEAHDIQPSFSCRSGSCGSCRTQVLAGDVTYTTEPSAEVARGEALICCSVPARSDIGNYGHLVLDI